MTVAVGRWWCGGRRRRAGSLGSCAAAVALCLLSSASAPDVALGYDIRVSWEPSDGAAGYRLHLRAQPGAASASIDVGTAESGEQGQRSAVVRGLELGPALEVAVSAYDGSGLEGDRSPVVSLPYERTAQVVDSDGDGLVDAREDIDLDLRVDVGETDPLNPDSDGDGLSDGSEVLEHGTDPLRADSDGDGLSDADEIALGSDPLEPDLAESSCAGGSLDAADACDDSNACTMDSCLAGSCIHTPAAGSCDDGIACTVADTCRDGRCVGVDGCSQGQACNRFSGLCEFTGDSSIWIAAATAAGAELAGAMTTGTRFAQGNDSDPFADSLVPFLVHADAERSGAVEDGDGSVSWTVEIPAEDDWWLWGRFYEPAPASSDGGAYFRAEIDGDDSRVFGFEPGVTDRWHWSGQPGAGSPQPLYLGRLAAGAHTLTVRTRAGGPGATRIDVLVLTRDPFAVPTDEEASERLQPCAGAGCRPITGPCGDADGDGRVSLNDGRLMLLGLIDLAFCPFARCDVDSDGMLTITDAIQTVSAVVAKAPAGVCTPSIVIAVHDAELMERIELTVGHQRADARLADLSRSVRCLSAVPHLTEGLRVAAEPAAGRVRLELTLRSPVSGTMDVLDCRYFPRAGGPMLPAPESFDLAVVGFDSPLGDVALPRVEMSLAVPLGAETADAWK